MAIAVLGPLSVDDEAVSLGPRDRVVLAALALRPGEVVSAERLADALWGERPPASGPKVVQGCVVRLRKALGPPAIETKGAGYRLVLPVDDVDSQRFQRLVGRARELLTLGEPERAAHVAREALALWRGPALVDLEGWEAGRIEAARLEELHRDARELALDAALQAGRHREVLAEAQAAVAEAPLRERGWTLLALAEYRSGRQGEALRTLYRARTVLVGELGVDPGPELADLEAAILRQDPELAAPVAARPAPSASCPYRGLLAYDVADADGFFGRDGDVAACLRRLAAVGVLVVVGPSGGGKSSLVRAGVAAALERDGRTVVVVSPGAHPGHALVGVPASGPAPVLVVDQCEEAVTLCADPGERAEFFAALAAHSRRAPLVMALRADRLADLSAYPDFVRLIEPGLHLLGAMGEDDLRAAIEGPAHQAGLLLEPGLVELLLRDVEGEPGALPLLSHALRQTWARREAGTLTVVGYRQTGGIRGAVAQSAEALYEQVPPEQRPQLRDLMLRLVAPSPDGDPVRSRLPRRLVATDPAHEQLVELLVGARLVTSDDEVVELAHEALARAWPRLQGWLDDDIEGQRILRHVTSAADTWEAMGHPESELYRGVRLARAQEWRERADPDLSPTERAFLDAGQAPAATERQSVELRARHQVRVNRRLRALLAAVGVLMVASLVAGLVAVRQRDRAQETATVADAGRISAQALTVEHLDRSLLLAVEGRRLHDSVDTRANLLAALNRSPAAVRIARSPGGRPQRLTVTGDGTTVVFPDNHGTLYFLDATTLKPSAEAIHVGGPIQSMTAVPGGPVLAVAIGTDPSGATIRFIDTTTGHEVRDPLPGADRIVNALDVSADGRDLAVANQGDPALGPAYQTIWDLADPGSPPRQVVQGIDAPGIAFTPAGELVVAGLGSAPDAGLSVVDPATGVVRLAVPDLHGPVAVSPDGRTAVATVGDSRTALALVDLATGSRRDLPPGHSTAISAVAFSPDGRSLASVGDDRAVVVWDPATATRTAVLEGHSGWVHGVDFGPDGTLYTSSLDGTVIAWDLAGDRRLVRRLAPTGPPRCPLTPTCPTFVYPSPDGDTVAYRYTVIGSSDTIAFSDLNGGGTVPQAAPGSREVFAAEWAPDGRHFVTVGDDDTVRLWDPGTGVPMAAQAVDGETRAIGSRPGGDSIAVGNVDGVIELDAETLAPRRDLIPLDGGVFTVAISPDDRLLAAGLEAPYALALVDRRSGGVLAVLDGVDAASKLAFSPDGSRLVAGGQAGTLRFIDVAGRRPAGPTLQANDGPLTSLRFSPDGATLLTAGTDGVVTLWDVVSGSRLGRVMPGPPNGVYAWAWIDDDGREVVIADQLGGLWSLPAGPEAWQRHACQVAGRSLTRDEWHELIGDRPYHATCGRRRRRDRGRTRESGADVGPDRVASHGRGLGHAHALGDPQRVDEIAAAGTREGEAQETASTGTPTPAASPVDTSGRARRLRLCQRS